MASNIDFINYVCEQINACGEITAKKMFGEYLIYCNGKPVILVCDNVAFVKVNDTTSGIVGDAEIGEPYKGAKPYYVIENIDDREFMVKVVTELEKITPIPKVKAKKAKKIEN